MFKTVIIKNEQIEKQKLDVPNNRISKVSDSSSHSRNGYWHSVRSGQPWLRDRVFLLSWKARNTIFKSIFDLGVSLEPKNDHNIPIMNPLVFFGTLFLGVLIWSVKYL